MKHEINLDSYPIHTDLAIDIIENKCDLEGVKQTIKSVYDITITDVCLSKKNSLEKKKVIILR